MAQQIVVVRGDLPELIKQVNILAATFNIHLIQKTSSVGSYLVVYEDAAPAGQVAVIITGDPDTVENKLTLLASSGKNLLILEETFANSQYALVYA